jgi:tetratricopeptide (TPR) repeat protein
MTSLLDDLSDSQPESIASVRDNLCTLYMTRYETTGSLADVESAISHAKEALRIWRNVGDAEICAHTERNLGNAMIGMYERSGIGEHAESAESCYKSALDVHLAAGLEAEAALDRWALGSLLYLRYDEKGDILCFEESLSYLLGAAAQFEQQGNKSNLADTLQNIGTLYALRYGRENEEEDAEKASSCLRRALGILPSGCATWAMAQHNLGNVYSNRYEKSHRGEYAGIAVRCFEASLRVRDALKSPNDWALSHQSLGALYYSRYINSGRERFAHDALHHLTEALRGFPRTQAPALWAFIHQSLASLHDAWFRKSGNWHHARRALRHSRLVLAAARASHIPPIYRFRSALVQTDIYFRQAQHRLCRRAYAEAEAHFHELYGMSPLRASRQTWLKEFQGLPALASFACARDGAIDAAVGILERSVALQLAEGLERADAEKALVDTAPELHRQFRRAAARLTSLENIDTHVMMQGRDIRSAVADACGEYSRTIEKIRCLPGFEDFLRPGDTEGVIEALSEACSSTGGHDSFLFLATTEHGSVAFISGQKGFNTVFSPFSSRDLAPLWTE